MQTASIGHISDAYRAEQEALHEKGNYGTASIGYAPLVSQIIERMGITHLLDYGCGAQCNLAKNLKVKSKLTYQAYDPGVPRFAKAPLPAQMVACIDVLEHVEPQYLNGVLDELAALTEGVCFLSIHTGPAIKVLSDGRNAHLIQEPMEFWLPMIMKRWEIQTAQVSNEHGFFIIGLAKSRLEAQSGEAII